MCDAGMMLKAARHSRILDEHCSGSGHQAVTITTIDSTIDRRRCDATLLTSSIELNQLCSAKNTSTTFSKPATADSCCCVEPHIPKSGRRENRLDIVTHTFFTRSKHFAQICSKLQELALTNLQILVGLSWSVRTKWSIAKPIWTDADASQVVVKPSSSTISKIIDPKAHVAKPFNLIFETVDRCDDFILSLKLFIHWLADRCWLLAAGCWLLAAGCWLLAAGCCVESCAAFKDFGRTLFRFWTSSSHHHHHWLYHRPT